MSYVVARMQKLKADNLVGLGNHNQRKTANHSNQDIDVVRSPLNYDLVEGRTENFKTDIQAYINENKVGNRATRKDAVLVNEWIITSDKTFFERLDGNQTRTYFETVKQYFADNFGEDNIRYAIVHLDEHTPHMHMGIVPFDDEYKLSAKRVFNRENLQRIQDELPGVLQAKGFKIERGEKGTERKNLTVPEYKAMQKELETVKTETEKQRQALADYADYKVTDFDVSQVEVIQPRFKKGYVQIKREDFDKLKQGALATNIASKEASRAKYEAEMQRDRTRKAESKAHGLSVRNRKLHAFETENRRLKTYLKNAQNLIKELTNLIQEKLAMQLKPDAWAKIGLKAPKKVSKRSEQEEQRNSGRSR